MSMYKNQCMINSMMEYSFEDSAGICELVEVLKIFLFSSYGFIQIGFVFLLLLFYFFVFVLWVKNNFCQNLMLLNFLLSEDVFSL